VQVCETRSLGHAGRLAVDAAGRGEKVVAVGGDGLVGAVAAALADTGGVFGIVPAGRGNDFARMLGIPFRTAAAARVLRTGQPRKIDLIGVRVGDGPEQVVAGSVYLGIPSEGGEVANRSRIPSGTVKYKIAGVRATLGYKHATFTVEPDPARPQGHAEEPGSGGGTHRGGGAHSADRTGSGGARPADGTGSGRAAASTGGSPFAGQAVVVANSGYLAAGTLAAPAADVTDGLLDVIMVSGEQRLSFLRVMLAAGRGTHLRLDEVSTLRSPAVTVTADRAMLAGADGEALTHASPLAAGSALRVRAIPAAVQVLSPIPATPHRSGRHVPPQQTDEGHPVCQASGGG
jgi:diacylglycerol kinase family enzyme